MGEQFDPDLVEALAAYCHDKQWSGWMSYIRENASVDPEAGTWTIPAWAVKRWSMQMDTPYAKLPEEMRESDRDEARAILAKLAEDGRLGTEKEYQDRSGNEAYEPRFAAFFRYVGPWRPV